MALGLLVAANLVPLLGVLFLGWNVATILIMYWLENGIVGALNGVRMLLAAGPDASGYAAPVARVGLTAFFCVHYGIFWVVHGVFVVVLTGGFVGVGLLDPAGFVLAEPTILLGALALLASHLASLVLNFIGRGEYRTISPSGQMWLPYPRMVVLHLTIIAGGMLVLGQGQPVLLVALLVVFKTLADVVLHLVERVRYRRAALAV